MKSKLGGLAWSKTPIHFMSLLTNNSLPAERERGCVFAERFENAASVVENGGSITGTPVIDHGVQIAGSEYITYNIPAGTLGCTGISVVFEFDASALPVGTFYDATNGQRTYLLITVGGDLRVGMGNTTVQDVAKATYEAALNATGKNYMAVYGTSGDTSIYLNGTKILDSDATAWSVTSPDPTELYVGANYAGGGGGDNFTVRNIKYFCGALTDQEALDYSNGGGFWNYINESTDNWLMDLENNDPTNLQTKGLKGNDLTFGDGFTSSTYPTKNTNEWGYSFDGSNQYLDGGNNTNLNVGDGDFTIKAWIKCTDQPSSTETIIGKGSYNSGGISYRLVVNSSGIIRFAIDDDTSAKIAGTFYVSDQTWHQVIGVREGTNIKVYVDGVLDETSAIGSYGNLDSPRSFYVGTFFDDNTDLLGTFFDGKIARGELWVGKALTPMQIKDLYLRELKQLNDL